MLPHPELPSPLFFERAQPAYIICFPTEYKLSVVSDTCELALFLLNVQRFVFLPRAAFNSSFRSLRNLGCLG